MQNRIIKTSTILIVCLLNFDVVILGLDSEIDIQKTTQLIRLKRPGMIQTQV